MKKVKQFFVLFCISGSVSMYSQIGSGGFKLPEESGLPDVLLNFDAVFDQTKVELTWSSNTEINNNYYVIEKSKDAMNFEGVATIRGFGNNSNIISYFDVDFTPFDGISYYRLTQIGDKGSVLSSRLVSVNNNKALNSTPAAATTFIDSQETLMGTENREVLVVLRNEKGEESFSKVTIDKKNIVTSTNDAVKLDTGTYTIVASSDNKLFSQRVVVK